jgi:PAS domain S-box-containing protein
MPLRSENDAVRLSPVRSFVQQFRGEILAAWRRAARTLPAAEDLDAVTLLDHIPALLDEIGEIAAELAIDEPVDPVFETARRHALDRLNEGFDIAAVVSELSLLRGAVLAVWARANPGGDLAELRALDLAIDRAIAASVSRYAEAHARTLSGIDQALASSQQRFKDIAAERERALAKLESLLAASPIGIAFFDRDLRYLRINDALAAVNGPAADDHIGRTVAEMLPDLAPRLEPVLRRVFETGEPALNLELTRPTARDPEDVRSFLASYFPVRAPSGEVTGVGGIVLDVTEVKRAQQALRVEQVRIHSILEHAPCAIWVKDHAGRVVLANHRLADVIGHHDDLVGRRSADFLPGEVAAEHEAHDERVVREGRAIEVEEAVPTPDGVRTFLSIKFPIPGQPPLIGGIATEITQRKQIEQELRLAVRMRDDVLAVVSHDLRGPLGTVQLCATLVLGQLAADHRARRHLETIHRCCTRMEHLIDDLLDTASIRTGRLQLELKREPADAVVGEALELQRLLAEERRVALVCDGALPGLQISCDRERILQVFGNLIGNAIKFCRPGDTITVRGQRTGDDVVFSVADTGPGIPAQVVPYLFDLYWSGAEHTRKGSGLGLYISRGIIEGHGGRIWVDSALGAGATFSFTLPVDEVAPPEPPRDGGKPPLHGPRSGGSQLRSGHAAGAQARSARRHDDRGQRHHRLGDLHQPAPGGPGR